MRLQWVSAAILGAALATGCGDKGQQNSQNTDQAATATPADATGVDRQPVSPDADNSAVRPDSSGSQATAGSRLSTPAKPAPSRRSEAARDVAPRENRESRESAAPVRVTRELTVPTGTTLPLELMTALSSET